VVKLPASVAVCGPIVMGAEAVGLAIELEIEVLAALAVVLAGPPSSVDRSGLFGYSLFDILYVSPA
jgi:hypothetical protein